MRLWIAKSAAAASQFKCGGLSIAEWPNAICEAEAADIRCPGRDSPDSRSAI